MSLPDRDSADSVRRPLRTNPPSKPAVVGNRRAGLHTVVNPVSLDRRTPETRKSQVMASVRVPLICLAAFLLLAAGCGTPPRRSAESQEAPLHLYLLAGQSNMAGRGDVGELDRALVPNLFALNSAMEWGPAKNPLHFDKPEIVGVGPGFAFGQAMAEANPGARIGLIPGAVGGSSIRAWLPNGVHTQTNSRPWDDALSRTFRVLAQHGGQLKGIIWHQGESDSNEFAPQYEDALVDLVERFRHEFHDPELPFVAAPLAAYYVATNPIAADINAATADLSNRLPHTAVISAEGMNPRADNVHLDSASARALGQRYAAAMLALQSQ